MEPRGRVGRGGGAIEDEFVLGPGAAATELKELEGKVDDKAAGGMISKEADRLRGIGRGGSAGVREGERAGEREGPEMTALEGRLRIQGGGKVAELEGEGEPSTLSREMRGAPGVVEPERGGGGGPTASGPTSRRPPESNDRIDSGDSALAPLPAPIVP